MKRRLGFLLALVIGLTGAVPVFANDWQAKVDASVLDAAASGRTDFIVYLRAKADLAPAAQLGSKQAKGAFVYDALTTTARNSQAPLAALLRDLDADYRSFWISNSLVVSGGMEVLRAMAERPDVGNVYAVGKGELHWPVDGPGGTQAVDSTLVVGPSIAHVNADDAWALGYRGQGAVVAGADTGVRWSHNAIRRQYRGFDSATGTADHNYNWHNAAGPNAACPTDVVDTAPCDDHDHGTHTVGTMVGDDGGANQIGLAPEAEWIACRNMTQGFGVVPSYMDCMQWFIAPTDLAGNNPDPSKAPDVVNNSWGCVEVCAPPLLKDMIDASRAAGIFYAVSAGNDNQFFLGLTTLCNTINFPLAVYDAAFTVGATNATNDNIASFSSLGPVADNPAEGINYRKPDIVAPGVGIRSSLSGNDNEYGNFSGTSMSGPHVAGLVALIISANPALRGYVDTIEQVIRQSAVPLTSSKGCGGDSSTQVPNNVFGWGRIDALAAVQLAAITDPGPTYTRNLVGLPAQVVDVTKETLTQSHPTTEFGPDGQRQGTTEWRVVKDTGNCCENHVTTSSAGRLFDVGGSFINYTDDRGLSWKSVRPLDPLFNGEGSMAMAPNGDVIGMTWDAYTGDHFVAYKYNVETGQWLTLTNKLHQPVYDRPWLTVIPGPFTDAAGKTVPYIAIVQGGTGLKDPMWVSTDGLIYVEPSSLNLGSQSSDDATGWFPISADPSFDWIQPIRRAPVTGLGNGYAVATGGFQLDPLTREWHPWRLPDGSVPPAFIQVDSAGRIHEVRSAGAGSLEYRISSNGGESWNSTIVELPFGGLVDFKVNRAVGVSALALRLNNQDLVYKFDISGDAAQLLRRYRVGLGDNPAGSSIGALTNPRMDFQTVAIFPDGRVAASFLDSTTFSHPPGTGMLGRITPALAIELDTTFDVEPTPTNTPSPTPTDKPSPTPTPTDTPTPTPTATPAPGDLATGGGWLADSSGKKINFGFRAEETASGIEGDLSLNDKGIDVKIAITAFSYLGPITADCAGIADAPNTLQLEGTGTFDGAPASFRACVADNGHPGNGNGSAADQLHLECVDGCTYSTATRVAANSLGGGNIDVQRAPDESSATASDATSSTAASDTATDSSTDSSAPATLILDPVLLSEAAAGEAFSLTVRVFDGEQRPLANAAVSVTVIGGATTTTVTAVSDLGGLVTFALTALGSGAEYIASAGYATSNAVALAPPVAAPVGLTTSGGW